MSKTKRTFDANYKLYICELIRRQGLTITQVCTDNSLGQSDVVPLIRPLNLVL